MKRILVVDDDEMILNAFRFAVDDNPQLTMDAAISFQEGQSLVDENRYDLIFLDLNMPGEKGDKLLAHIRSKDLSVPVCIITAYFHRFASELKEMEKKGYEYSLENKPFGAARIKSIIDSFLGDEPTSMRDKVA